MERRLDRERESGSLGLSLFVTQILVLGWSVLRLRVGAAAGLDLDEGLAVVVALAVTAWIAATLSRQLSGYGGRGRRRPMARPNAIVMRLVREGAPRLYSAPASVGDPAGVE